MGNVVENHNFHIFQQHPPLFPLCQQNRPDPDSDWSKSLWGPGPPLRRLTGKTQPSESRQGYQCG